MTRRDVIFSLALLLRIRVAKQLDMTAYVLDQILIHIPAYFQCCYTMEENVM